MLDRVQTIDHHRCARKRARRVIEVKLITGKIVTQDGLRDRAMV